MRSKVDKKLMHVLIEWLIYQYYVHLSQLSNFIYMEMITDKVQLMFYPSS